VAGDEVVVSANIHNYLAEPKSVKAVLEVDGRQLTPRGETQSGENAHMLTTSRTVEVAAGGRGAGRLARKGQRRGQNHGPCARASATASPDAMQLELPVSVHGLLKTESWSRSLRPEQESASIELRVPAERQVDQSRLEVRYSPTLAGALVDAVPYLADYPYGCTEQTLNRFLPTVVAQQVIRRDGARSGRTAAKNRLI